MSIHTRGTDPLEPLEAVLRAATAPGHPEELAGEHVAVAAFRAAAGARRRSWLARVLTVKVLVVGGVAVSTGVVLAAVGGALPLPGVGPSAPPADQPSITRPAVIPSETPQDGPTSTTGEPGPSTPPPSTGEPCDDCGGKDAKEDKQEDGRGPGKKGDDKHEQQPPPPEEQSDNTDWTTQPSFSRTPTPDSPAQGAVTAVPPNGAESSSPGG